MLRYSALSHTVYAPGEEAAQHSHRTLLLPLCVLLTQKARTTQVHKVRSNQFKIQILFHRSACLELLGLLKGHGVTKLKRAVAGFGCRCL